MNSLNSLSTRASSSLTFLFAIATFWCSALIFWVEPLVGKQLLPLVGGAPAVWNICLLFFQTALLLGYACAHGLVRIPNRRLQALLYLLLLGLGFVLLPIRFEDPPLNPDQPALWLLLQLTAKLGLPFIALAAASPLAQHWYAHARGISERDPYFLYAASNAGSLLALLAYPVVIEPVWPIQTQNIAWAALYVVGIALLAAAFLRAKPDAPFGIAANPTAPDPPAPALAPAPAPSFRRWVAYAAIPSSLLLGVTSYLTADLAPIPLLWVVPLALYLLSFVIAFGWLQGGPPAWLTRGAVILAVPWAAVYRLQPSHPLLLLAATHLLFFLAVAVAIHSRLSAIRPPARQLTRFYLAIALGGAMGGAFNALIAPVVFDSFAEYPMVALLGLFVASHSSGERVSLQRDGLPALALGLVVLALVLWPRLQQERILAAVLCVGIPAFAAYLMSGRIPRFVLALAALLLTVRADAAVYNRVLHAERNFYGLLRVTQSRSGRFVELRHGSTLHGAADRRQAGGSEPLTYYSLAGPVADVLNEVQRTPAARRIGVVGLGVGTLAYYASPDETWDFFEINPAVEPLARDSALFGFLHRSKAGRIRVIAGDARLTLQDEPDASFDLLVLDAFTSDAIPLHLLTREAVQLYFRKSKPNAMVVFHISNRYLNLAPVLGNIARAAGLVTIDRDDWIKTIDDRVKRIEGSSWLVMARHERDLGALARNPRWYRVQPARNRVWTDDYSNVWHAWSE